MNSLLTRIRVGFLIRLIPLVLYWLLLRGISYLIQTHNSIKNALLVYEIFLVLLIVALLSDAVIDTLNGRKPRWVRVLFTFLFLIAFLPVLVILGILGKLIIICLKKITNNKISSPVTGILGSITMFTTGLFVSFSGQLKLLKEIWKAVIIMNHRGAGDYFIVTCISLFRQWMVMIGANLLKWQFVFRWFFSAVGIIIKREAEAESERTGAVYKAKTFLRSLKKAFLIVFPEGTRNRDPKKAIMPFKLGAFKIACDLNIPVIVVIAVGSDDWRRSGPQDTTSYKNKKDRAKEERKSFFVQFKRLVNRIFKEGINPTIVRVIVLGKVETIGKTPEQVSDEAYKMMEAGYKKHAKLEVQ